MAKRIIIPEEQLHDIADAINNRADYLDDINDDTSVRDSLEETADRQMYSDDMAANILRLRVNLSRYYTKEEIDQMFQDDTIDILYVSGNKDDIPAENRSERLLYIVNEGNNRYTVWTWRNNGWLMLGGNVIQSDLNNYYTKAEIDQCCATKQDKLTAGDRITIDQNNVISADISRSYKYEASLENPVGSITQGTLEEVANPDNDPIFAILGEAPIYITLDENSNGYIVLNIDPDALEGSANIPLNDSSSKVATTRFVGQKIEEAIGGLSGLVKYVVFEDENEEEQYPDPKEYGTIYANDETKNVYFGDILLNGGIIWNVLPSVQPTYVYMLYRSGFVGLEDEVIQSGMGEYDWVPSYTDKFYNPWQTSQFVPFTAQSLLDPTATQTLQQSEPVATLLTALGITEYGDEEHPVVELTPDFSNMGDCPFYGWASGNEFVTIYNGIAKKVAYQYDADNGEEISTIPLLDNIPSFNFGQTTDIEPYYPGNTFVSWGNSSTVDWTWTGQIDANWDQITYNGISDLFQHYKNDAVDDILQIQQHRDIIIYDHINTEEEVNEEISYRYAFELVANASRPDAWQPTEYFPEDLINAQFTLEEFKAAMENLLLESEDLTFTPAPVLSPVTISNPSYYSGRVFFIYIQGYTGTGDDIEVVSNYIRILKGWDGSESIVYGTPSESE